MRIRFGDFVLDPDSRQLLRGDKGVHLPRKAFQLLELLLRHSPRALSKSEIHDALWPRTFVSGSSLARLVAQVRHALGDDSAEPRLLRTVYGHGYAFSGEVAPDAGTTRRGASSCALTWGPREIPLSEGENILGRAPDATVCIDSNRVSRRHARIVVACGRAVVEDLGSKNGTFVRGHRIEAATELLRGDEICVGPALLVFRREGGEGTTTKSDVRS